MWMHRALIFLVVSCPCALVISVPLSFFGGIGGASQCGILVKGSNYLEALAETEIVVFDKTGTLTKGVFHVTAVHPDEISEDGAAGAGGARRRAIPSHPIARSILRAPTAGASTGTRVDRRGGAVRPRACSAMVDGRNGAAWATAS